MAQPDLAETAPVVETIALACDDPAVADRVVDSLRQVARGLTRLRGRRFSLTVTVVDREALPALPAGLATQRRHGQYEVARTDGGWFYQADADARLELSTRAWAGRVWITRPAALEQPVLRQLTSILVLHLAQRCGVYGLHAAALTRSGAGYLLPGPSGSGKTSVALALVAGGAFRYVSDDSVLLWRDSDGIRCSAVWDTFNVEPAGAPYPTDLARARGVRRLDTGKLSFRPEQLYPGSRADDCRPTCLIFPRIVDAAESTMRPVSQTEALGRLLCQTALPPDRDAARRQLDVLALLIRQSATYELAHGRDVLVDASRVLTRLLAGVGAARAS